jgi:hypothetical protein
VLDCNMAGCHTCDRRGSHPVALAECRGSARRPRDARRRPFGARSRCGRSPSIGIPEIRDTHRPELIAKPAVQRASRNYGSRPL